MKSREEGEALTGEGRNGKTRLQLVAFHAPLVTAIEGENG
jgi:hypothetical protein